MTRILLFKNKTPAYFWAKVVSTACYISNRIFPRQILEKTPCELFKGKIPNVSYFWIFGCKCFILKNPNERVGKFDEKSNEGIFLKYSTTSKAYKVYNKNTQTVEESLKIGRAHV